MTDLELRLGVDAVVTDGLHEDADFVLRRQEIMRKLSASVISAQTAFPCATKQTSSLKKAGPLPPGPPGPI